MAYKTKVIDHFENPRNVGTLDKSDPEVGTGLVGAPACGDVMHLEGTQIDYVTSLMGMGFKFINPNATKTCGCGSSFG